MEGHDELAELIGNIPACGASSTPEPRCCCGDPDCASLAINRLSLDKLESEVRTAAKLGQALLARHEQYMHDAEKERLKMSAKIEQLESDKKLLEDENAKIIEDNGDLLNQFEELNQTMENSELLIKSLEETLDSTRQEFRRLELLASRTEELEMQMTELEQEQQTLQRTILITQEEERTAIQRWKTAERKLIDVQEQLERIDREAREERERHVEVLGRMERQRAVERELSTAAGRLKGAAAAGLTTKPSANVVSHFVKDILQDNANLQSGIVELREMLLNSNDEVQMLREQLMLHKPIEGDEAKSSPHPPLPPSTTLNTELTSKNSQDAPVISQSLHIHHHYHAPPRREELRRTRKKRISIHNGMHSSPQSLNSRITRRRDTAQTILSQTPVTVPGPTTPENNCWSVQSAPLSEFALSEFAPSSSPSSPQSMFQHSSMFDRTVDVDSSRPTSSSSSVDSASPMPCARHHRKQGFEVSMRSCAQPKNFQEPVIHEEVVVDDGDSDRTNDVEELPNLQRPSTSTPLNSRQISSFELPDSKNSDRNWASTFEPGHRRCNSHESIVSVSGVDIRNLQARQPRRTVSRAHFIIPRIGFGSARTIGSGETVTSSSLVTAQPVLSSQEFDSRSYLRSNIVANGIDYSSSSSYSTHSTNVAPGLTSKLGGWVKGRWGISPTKAAQNATPSPRSVHRTTDHPSPLDAAQVLCRSPGINQKGPIPGFMKKADRLPSQVEPIAVDQDALREVFFQ